MKHLLTLILVAIVGVTSSTAQDETDDLVHVSYVKCDFAELADQIAQYDSLSIPIRQELVNEGLISYHAMNTHFYGDEWNVLFVTRGKSFENIEAARVEANRRLNERHRDLEFAGTCTEHKDNVYWVRAETATN